MRTPIRAAVVLAAALLIPLAPSVGAQTPRFFNMVDGSQLDFTGLKETETEAVKSFRSTGHNPYNKDAAAIAKGESLYSTACSGCHGHHAEGKLGPGLADDYWTYSRNNTDDGLFSSIFGGLQGSMGPQRNRLTQDEILHVMAWLRSIYKGDPAKVGWKQ